MAKVCKILILYYLSFLYSPSNVLSCSMILGNVDWWVKTFRRRKNDSFWPWIWVTTCKYKAEWEAATYLSQKVYFDYLITILNWLFYFILFRLKIPILFKVSDYFCCFVCLWSDKSLGKSQNALALTAGWEPASRWRHSTFYLSYSWFVCWFLILTFYPKTLWSLHCCQINAFILWITHIAMSDSRVIYFWVEENTGILTLF